MDQREVEQAIERIKIDYKEVQQIREKQNKLEKMQNRLEICRKLERFGRIDQREV